MPELSEQFIVVGDIHGCPDQLEEILSAASAYPRHRLVFLGDYIDRGPDSEAVVNRVRNLDAIFIFGNHEDMLLNALKNGKQPIPDSHENLHLNLRLSKSSIEWIASVPVPIFESENYIFTHAGLNTELSLERQKPRDYYWSIPYGDYLHLTEKIVVHGHMDVHEPEIEKNRINVNTGCGSRGRLSAVVLPEMDFLTSSVSPGHQTDWDTIRERLEQELKELEESIDSGLIEELEVVD